MFYFQIFYFPLNMRVILFQIITKARIVLKIYVM